MRPRPVCPPPPGAIPEPAGFSRTARAADVSRVSDAPPPPRTAEPTATPIALPARLAALPVPVAVRLAEKRVPLSAVRALVPGSLVTFEKGCEEPLELFVSDAARRPHAVGEAVKVGERFGLKITAVRPN